MLEQKVKFQNVAGAFSSCCCMCYNLMNFVTSLKKSFLCFCSMCFKVGLWVCSYKCIFILFLPAWEQMIPDVLGSWTRSLYTSIVNTKCAWCLKAVNTVWNMCMNSAAIYSANLSDLPRCVLQIQKTMYDLRQTMDLFRCTLKIKSLSDMWSYQIIKWSGKQHNL